MSSAALCLLRFLRPEPPLIFFFFNDTATTEIYTLSLHDALPICRATQPDDHYLGPPLPRLPDQLPDAAGRGAQRVELVDRKSTRLNSSHLVISYAVFCLKKKKNRIDDRKLLQSCSYVELQVSGYT